jgi:hypothetical protein
MSGVVMLANRPADRLEVFRERCLARALLVREGLMDFHDAVDNLQNAAVAYGLVDRFGQDKIQAIIAEAFDEEISELQSSVDDILRRWELADPRDGWRHTGETPPPAAFRNSDISGKPVDNPRRYRTAQSTIDAFWYVVRLDDPDYLARWLADHPRDAAHLLKIWKAKPC